ncbi:MAG: hypothetical protein UT33_C0012G0045 [Candidatus Peregrinibacteria bacterium GW2011_GWC2_39_14]|nr:MAG: hypothetical protein US92_C0003G0072 [Candidatus Peregrinibacteria bacterium GW2011_GWA2_38_36]KKR05240.1 MAG: hypothetical protein UT33_C0012G0045 [Candidatus Peregrinibacteria bacterium GW2011_GWC2_39_14]
MKNEMQNFISLQEAASLSKKAEQTIRRAIKAKKIGVKRQKTPQGFVYLVDKADVTKLYNCEESNIKEKKTVSASQTTSRETSQSDSQENIGLNSQNKKTTSQKTSKKSTSQKGTEVIEKSNTELSVDYTAMMEFQKLLTGIVEQHQREREHSGRFMKELQDKVMFLEHQVMQLQAPKKKWFQVWK